MRPSHLHQTFGVASYLNQPEFIEFYDETGALLSSYANGTGWYGVDMARHIESPAAGRVDSFGIHVADDGSGATVLGFASASASAGPAWSTLLPGCSLDGGGGTYVGFEASDSGARVAVQCYQNATAGVVALDGQTGAVLWHYALGQGVKAGQGQVQITGDGAWVLLVNEQGVPTPNSATAYVINGATGVLRGAVPIPFFITAAISDSGNYLAVGDNGLVHLYEWDAASSRYAPSQAAPVITPPGSFLPWDLQMSTGPDAGEFLILGCISYDVMTVQVTAWGVVNGTLIHTWQSATNTDKLQENPSLRADGAYIGVSLWGDSGNTPTVVLLRVGTPAPIFHFTSPGSMFAVDLALDKTGPSGDTVLLTASGKAVPANEFGNGGDAYGWEITVPAGGAAPTARRAL